MIQQKVTIPIFDSFKNIVIERAIFITDENIFALHSSKFRNKRLIVIKAGEKYKTQSSVNTIIKQLINHKVDKSCTLVAVGGGVVTDLVGFVATTYMRGIPFGFVPTTLLCMVDAAIGGKNGINFGLYKNFIGTIQQPQFIINDISFLSTLPQVEWQNGFAEIIKHACIKSATMFKNLQQHNINFYKKNKTALQQLIQQNIDIKMAVVKKDVNEKGDRKLLNFGHTLGHAIENLYKLPHGYAVTIGMCFASKLSSNINQFNDGQTIEQLITQYQLPTTLKFNKSKVLDIMQLDKKVLNEQMQFIVLTKIGNAKIEVINIELLNQILREL